MSVIKIQIVFYSMYGYVYQLAEAVAGGASFQGEHVAGIAHRLQGR